MKDPKLDRLVERRRRLLVPLHALMPFKVRRVMLVSSLYDSYTLNEEGRLSEMVFADYLDLNLSAAPVVERMSTGKEALERLDPERYDLIIAMPRVGEMDVHRFSRAAKEKAPDLPLVVLAGTARELKLVESLGPLPDVDRVFLWQGDQKLFLAIIKLVEDQANMQHDVDVAGVQCILLLEDSVKFYSSYLPLLYSEVVRQTQLVMADGVNAMQKLIRMRARPKILLATNYEAGLCLYEKYRDHVLGVVSDVSFARMGKRDDEAGISFAAMVKEDISDRPVLIQSTQARNRKKAQAVGAYFVSKTSPSLLRDVQGYLQDHLGFGDFIFRMPDMKRVGSASSLASLLKTVRTLPADSLMFHASRNHFSAWLMARTEFDLARALRPRRVGEFDSPDDLRSYLLKSLELHIGRTRAGVVAEFSDNEVAASNMFVRIGEGSLGGKGRGLAFMNAIFDTYKVDEHVPGVRIFVPPTAVLATGVFDRFMEASGLTSFVLVGADDEAVARAFVNARFPDEEREDLERFLEQVHYPLAVRSSSLLEDASFQPFAGVYRTYMVPNNAPDLETRLDELLTAIRLVYASTYYEEARSYIEATPNRLEEEKMAVVIQQVVGQPRGDALYPDFAGTARSRNFYPMEGMKPEDGIASVALGLGSMVVDGGKCVRFSPEHPQRLYQFSSVKESLRNAQREFCALDLTAPGPFDHSQSDPQRNMLKMTLEDARQHGTLAAVGSVYSPDNDAIYDGVSRPGVPLVTMAGVLKAGVFPLGETLSFLLKVGAAGFSAPVEMEFAVNLPSGPDQPDEFGFLQIRPLGLGPELHKLELDDIAPEDAICLTPRALGHGLLSGLQDIIYVKPQDFDRGRTVQVAQEIGVLNNQLRADDRNYVLMGQGRWGSSDRWLGIPVGWAQVSGVACIVEADMADVSVEPSQGTHFFQNITSLGISYLTVNFNRPGTVLDYDWLAAQPAATETAFVRHVRLPAGFDIAVDSRSGRGAILKPGVSIALRNQDS